jgi:hypothetical protein
MWQKLARAYATGLSAAGQSRRAAADEGFGF